MPNVLLAVPGKHECVRPGRGLDGKGRTSGHRFARPDADAVNTRLTGRDDRDIFRLAPSMDEGVLETIAARLEFRGTDEGYAQLSQAHFPRLPLRQARRILALGCGTGIEVRALRRLTGPDTAIVGIDHSQPLLDVARRLTEVERLFDNVTYQAGDAHHLSLTMASSTSSRSTR